VNKLTYTVSLNDNEKLRCIINNPSLALAARRYCCVGFFGTRSNDYSAGADICESDQMLISQLATFPGVLAYVTVHKDAPLHPEHMVNNNLLDYANIVIMEDFSTADEWRLNSCHVEAVQKSSPLYYHFVRINNALITLPQSSISSPRSSYSLEPMPITLIRSKYYSFKDGSLGWRGIRTYGELVITSFLSPSANSFFQFVVDSMSSELGINMKMVDIWQLVPQSRWSEPPHLLMEEFGIDCAFMCGLVYVKGSHSLEPISAPICSGTRYNNQSVYFSDIIIKSSNNDSNNINSIKDLKGRTFAYNGKESYSGYHVLRHHVQKVEGFNGTLEEYFGNNTTASGSHLKSIQMVLNNQCDTAAIDSTVLDVELLKNNGELAKNIRIVDQIGPSPMPPLVTRKDTMAYFQKSNIQAYLQQFGERHSDAIQRFGYLGFKSVDQSTYDPI
ncbi:hypothetical protein SAMD00019534_060980, partial [Acytostelium subglobosum LB1]|uniref:hypothetical protein n=1 Tax=Acytostelium subglobosum LB1 TaxID=1410327 RepID=UPI00064517D3